MVMLVFENWIQQLLYPVVVVVVQVKVKKLLAKIDILDSNYE